MASAAEPLVAAGVGFVLFLLVLATRRYRLVPAL